MPISAGTAILGGSLISGLGSMWSSNQASKAASNAAAAGADSQREAALIASQANEQAAQAQLQAAAMQDARLREMFDVTRYNFMPQQVGGNRAMSQISSLLGLGQLPINAPWDAERIRLDYTPGGAGDSTPQTFQDYMGSNIANQQLLGHLKDYDDRYAQVMSMDYHGDNKYRKAAAKAELERTTPRAVMQELNRWATGGGGDGDLSQAAQNYMQKNLYADYASGQMSGFGGVGAGLSPEQQAERNSRLQAMLPNEIQEALTPEQAQERAFGMFEKTPGYQFRMDEGNKAIQRLASARGNLGAGSMYKDLMRYGQDMASQEYGNYMSQLQSMAGLAPTAAAQVSSLGSNTAAQLANVAQGAGDARSSAYLGTGQAMSNSALAQGNLASQLAMTQGNINSNLTSNLTGQLGAFVSGGGFGGGGTTTQPSAALTNAVMGTTFGSPW